MRRSFLQRMRAALLLACLAVLAGSPTNGARPLVPGAAAPVAPALTILHNFNPAAEGAPAYGLTQGPDGSLYGVTTGSVPIAFQIAPDGTFRTLHRFSAFGDGLEPAAKLLLVGGQLFGTCNKGGDFPDSSDGTVFVITLAKVSPTDNGAGFGVIHYFTGYSFATGAYILDGSQPVAALSLASDGNLYGTTPRYGGTLFQIKPDAAGQFSLTARTSSSGVDTFNGTFNNIHDFFGAPGDGDVPLTGVVQGPGGFLYGTTNYGGSLNGGAVYRIGTDGQGLILLHSFPQIFNGLLISSELLFASDGGLYDASPLGGANSAGTLFQIKPGADGVFAADAPFQTVHDFTGGADGYQPWGVIQASDGNLYGTTSLGGGSGVYGGLVFKVAAAGGQFSATSALSTVYSFYLAHTGPTDPRDPSGPVIQGVDGRLYGETASGGQLADGTGYGGTVFAIDAGLPAPPAVSGIAGSIAPPDVTTADTTLTVHGSSFNGGDKVSVDGQNVPVTSRDYSKADEQITVTPAAPLTAGAHTVVVADTAPGIRVSSPVAFLVTLLSPRIVQITRGGGGSVTTADTTLVIHGDSFAPTDVIGGLSGVTISQKALDTGGSQFTLTLSKPLAAGHYAVTVTHAAPNGLVSNTYDLLVVTDAPVISAVSGGTSPPAVTPNDTTLVVHGTGFAAADAVVLTGTTASVTVAGRDLTTDPADEQITVTLSHPLAAGSYTAAVLHAAPDDRKSALFPFTVVKASAPTIDSTRYRVLTGEGMLSVFGTGFAPTGTTAITPNDPSVNLGGTRNIAYRNSGWLTLIFSQPLPSGVYTLTETNPDGQSAHTQVYVLAVTSAAHNPADPSVTLLGAGFAPGAAVSIGDAANGSVILPLHISADAKQIGVDLLNPLPPGPHTFTVTDPDGQTAQASLTVLSSPAITSLVYRATSSGSTLIINGSGFVETPSVSLANVFLNTVLTLKYPISSTQLIVTLDHPLPAGSQQVTVTNPDNQTATGTLTVGAAPLITPGGLTAVTGTSGNTILVVTGRNLAGATVDGAALTPDSTATVANTSGALITQLVFRLPSRYGDGPHAVVALNADGLGSNGTPAPPQGRAARPASSSARPASSSSSNTVNVFTSDRTSYKVASDDSGGFFGWLLGLFGIHLHANGGPPAQVIARNSSALLKLPTTLVMAAGGGTLTGVISNDGGSVISNDGGGVISNDGGTLTGVISNDGGSVISNDGGSLISNDGGGLIGQDGGGFISTKAQMETVDDAKAAENSVAFARPAASASIRALLASSGGGATLELAKSDQAGTGSSDMTLTSLDSGGNSVDVLRMRFTAGERDLVLYEAPGFHLTPTNGTPAPVAVVTTGVTVTRGPVTRDFHTHQPFQVLILTNTGAGALTGPFLIALTGLPAGVTVAGQAGVVAGSPAVAAPGSALAPGASVRVRVDFTDPTNARFSYGTAVYAGL